MSRGRSIDRLNDLLEDMERDVEDIIHDLKTEKRHRREDIMSIREDLEKVTTLLFLAENSDKGDTGLTPGGLGSNTISANKLHDEKYARLMSAFVKEKTSNIKMQQELRTLQNEIDQIKSFVAFKVSEYEIMMGTIDTLEESFNSKLSDMLGSISRNFTQVNMQLITEEQIKENIAKMFNETFKRNVLTEVRDSDEKFTTSSKPIATDASQVACMNDKDDQQYKCCARVRITGICTLTVNSEYEIPVYFDTRTDGGGWIVIQRRINGSTDFYRGWEEYKAGFGDLLGEFWLGNEYIHQLTAIANRELRIELEDENGQKAFAHYSHFQVLTEEEGYQLNVSGYTGTAGDSLSYHDGMKFSTFDKQYYLWTSKCALICNGAWWYNNCVRSNLNGKYGDNICVEWYSFSNFLVPMKETEMKIR